MKATLLKEIIYIKKGYGKTSTVTEYTLEQTNRTYRIGEIYDNVYQLKNKLKRIGYTSFEIVKIGKTTRRAQFI